MGTFYQAVKVGNPAGGDFVEVDAMVDTGALDSMFPASLLVELHLQPTIYFESTVADGRQIQLPYGQALIGIDDDTWVCLLVFGPGAEALLGATTLEIFKLLVDPNTMSLQPASHSHLCGGGRPYPL